MKDRIKKYIEDNPGCRLDEITATLQLSPVNVVDVVQLEATKEIIRRGDEYYPGTWSNTEILKHRAANRDKPKPVVNMIDALKKSVAPKSPGDPERPKATRKETKKKKGKKKLWQ